MNAPKYALLDYISGRELLDRDHYRLLVARVKRAEAAFLKASSELGDCAREHASLCHHPLIGLVEPRRASRVDNRIGFKRFSFLTRAGAPPPMAWYAPTDGSSSTTGRTFRGTDRRLL
jgi:hypothetical protein